MRLRNFAAPLLTCLTLAALSQPVSAGLSIIGGGQAEPAPEEFPADPATYLAEVIADFQGIGQPLFTPAAAPAACVPAEAPQSHALLLTSLASIGEYNFSVANDVALLQASLVSRGVKPANIHAPPPGTASFDQIAAAAQALLEGAQCGDSVLIHLTGISASADDIAPGTARLADFKVPDDPLRLTRMQRSSQELKRLADAGPFLLLAAPSQTGDALLSAAAVADLALALREKGVDVTVTLDTDKAESFAIESRHPAEGDGALWRNRLTPDGWESDWPTPTPPWFGALTVFYGATADEITSETRVTGEDGAEQNYGTFSFHLAMAILSADPATAEGLARTIGRMEEGGVDPEDADRTTSYLFLSTDPTRSVLREPILREPGADTDRFIRILSPEETRGAVQLTQAELVVTGQVVSPARALVVTVNGKVAELDPSGSFRHPLLLTPGANRIDIVAVTADNTPILRSVEYHYGGDIASLAGQGRRYALIIANQDYPEGSGLATLRTPLADAAALAEVLTARYGYQTSLILPEGAEMALMLQNPTRVEIETALYQLSRVLSEADSLLVFYAGHGIYEPATDGAFWLPADARADLPFSWLPAQAITDALLRIQAGSILVISDSCYSGALLRGDAAPASGPTEEDRMIALQKLAAGRSRIVISSGGNEPVLDGGGDGHSVFARALLEGLKAPEAGAFSARELFDRWLLPMVAGRAGQEPQYRPVARAGHETGDMVFVATGG